MVTQGYDTRKNFWLEVEDGWRGWIETPLRGADSSPTGWATDGTLANGGGYAVNSWGSHKRYTFEWPQSSARESAQFIKTLRDGSYGRGLIHFIEPTLYDQNVLPARIADPSMAVGNEGASMVYGLDPSSVETSNAAANHLPFRSAYYNLVNTPAGYRGDADSVYVSIPEGHTLYLGAFHQYTGTGGIFARPVNLNGTQGEDVRIPALTNDVPSATISATFEGIRGVRIWLGKTGTGVASVTAAGLIGKFGPAGELGIFGYTEGPYGQTEYGGRLAPPIVFDGWMGGMGNSGCRFVGTPTFINNTGLNGGTVGFSATFAEVGSWIYG